MYQYKQTESVTIICCFQERLTAGHGSITLTSTPPSSYGHSHGGSRGGQGGGGGGIHASMSQHQLTQPDFQPPYFPPPFHHAPPPSPPPQQSAAAAAAGLEYLSDPYGGLGGLHHYNQLGLRREPDPSHGHVVSTMFMFKIDR